MSRKCPECGCTEIWDAECEDCNGLDEDCETCGGSGVLDSLMECSGCGIIDYEVNFDDDEEATP